MSLQPTDHREAVAVFRAEIIGALTRRGLERGQLRAALVELSQQRFRPPGAKTTRTYAVSTLERWYYAYRRGGLEALKPSPRRDRGHGRALDPAQHQLVLDIARENPEVPASVILRTLVTDGRIAPGTLGVATLQRMLREHGLERARLRALGQTGRRRWQADAPGVLWHGDVCHGPALTIDAVSRPLRIHALLDDCSRYVVAIEAHHTETELDMVGLLARALRRHGRPSTLYLDNGPTYSGKALLTACARLEISLVHAAPYDPQARGKMERFWRTLRSQCLSHLGGHVTSLHQVNTRLWAWLDTHYHRAAHAGLLGRSPGRVYHQHRSADAELDEQRLREAFTVRRRRKLRGDSTLSIAGVDYELVHSFIRPGSMVVVAHCLLDEPARPVVEHDGAVLELHPVDAVANSRRRRQRPQPAPDKTIAFEPATALLDAATGRHPYHHEDSQS